MIRRIRTTLAGWRDTVRRWADAPPMTPLGAYRVIVFDVAARGCLRDRDRRTLTQLARAIGVDLADVDRDIAAAVALMPAYAAATGRDGSARQLQAVREAMGNHPRLWDVEDDR